MKKTLIDAKTLDFIPNEYLALISGSRIFDSSCSPEARVYFIDKDNGYYLKRSAVGTLAAEAEMTRYFHSKGLSAEVLSYKCDGESDWLLTSRVAGEDCTHADYLAEPKRLAVLLGEQLRELHSLDFSNCPIQNRMTAYRALAEKNYKARQYDLSYYVDKVECADDLWRDIESHHEYLNGRALLHGDYCLPNVLLDNWKFSGFIDLGNGGVGDPHIDLFWGAWTLRFNLHTDRFRERFFDAYGRDQIDPYMIELVEIIERFG
jgi:kanamycin kinase